MLHRPYPPNGFCTPDSARRLGSDRPIQNHCDKLGPIHLGDMSASRRTAVTPFASQRVQTRGSTFFLQFDRDTLKLNCIAIAPPGGYRLLRYRVVLVTLLVFLLTACSGNNTIPADMDTVSV
jgi:hypothetical protein